jgi:hypothetical protein
VTAGTHPLSSSQFPSALTVQVDGKTVGKFSPTGNNTYTINYKATKTGTATVKATITDSVLYQGSDSKTLTETVPPKVPSPGTGTGGNPGGGPGNGGGQNP